MGKAGRFFVVALLGLAVTAVGFAAYVATAQSPYIFVFIAGLALTIESYVALTFFNRKTYAEKEKIEKEEAENGYVYYMDGEPYPDKAPVSDFTAGYSQTATLSVRAVPYFGSIPVVAETSAAEAEEGYVCYMCGGPCADLPQIINLGEGKRRCPV